MSEKLRRRVEKPTTAISAWGGPKSELLMYGDTARLGVWSVGVGEALLRDANRCNSLVTSRSWIAKCSLTAAKGCG